MRWVAAALLALGTAAGAMWLLRPSVGEVSFDASAIGDDPAAYLARQEARFDDIVAGTEKRVVWRDGPGVRTDWVIVYLHGFSASSEETRPLPDRVAEALSANIVFTRLTGHGRDGTAMAEATPEAWLADLDEALAVAAQMGDRVLALSASTGGTLSALGAARGRDIDAHVMISPNFEPRATGAWLLTLPGARDWVPLLAGDTRDFEPENERHARYWTHEYPTEATVPMAVLVRGANVAPLDRIEAPALVLLSEEDDVVSPEATRDAMQRWGGPFTIEAVTPPSGNAPSNHVLAGDILSPDMTAPMAERIVRWVSTLP